MNIENIDNLRAIVTGEIEETFDLIKGGKYVGFNRLHELVGNDYDDLNDDLMSGDLTDYTKYRDGEPIFSISFDFGNGMTPEKMNGFIGMKWSDISEDDKSILLSDVTISSGVDCRSIDANEDYIVDLIYPLSVAGKVSMNGEGVEILDDAVIYNSEGGKYIF